MIFIQGGKQLLKFYSGGEKKQTYTIATITNYDNHNEEEEEG